MIQRHTVVLYFFLALGISACSTSGNSSLPGANVSSATASSVSSVQGEVVKAGTPVASLARVSRSAKSSKAQSGATYVAIDAGGGASGNWQADTDYGSGTSTTVVTTAINTSNVTNPAPMSVYQSARWAPILTYTIPGLIPGNPYSVRLHYAETYWTSSGHRVFSGTINNVQAFTNFDIFAAAGGKGIAVAEQYTTTADASGTITIVLTASRNNADVSGIELTALQSNVAAQQPKWADSFVDSVGINTHFGFTGTGYTSAQAVPDLVGLHVRHIRDFGTLNYDDPGYYQTLSSLTSNGIHSIITSNYNELISNLTSVMSLSNGSVEGIEYPNEWDLNGGTNWASTILTYGATLYAGKPQFGVSVIGPAFSNAIPYADFTAGAFNSIADSGNMHDYFSGNPDDATTGACSHHDVTDWMKCVQFSEPTPVIMTETGFPGASQSVQARYDVRVLLDAFNAGVVRTYLYQLIDNTSTTTYGLVDTSLNLKPAYAAVQNLLGTLSDAGAPPTLQPISFSLSGAVEHVLLQKRNGEYHLLIWDPVLAADPSTPSVPVTLTFGTTPKSLTQNVWQDTGSVVSTKLTPALAISMPVTDRLMDIVIN